MPRLRAGRWRCWRSRWQLQARRLRNGAACSDLSSPEPAGCQIASSGGRVRGHRAAAVLPYAKRAGAPQDDGAESTNSAQQADSVARPPRATSGAAVILIADTSPGTLVAALAADGSPHSEPSSIALLSPGVVDVERGCGGTSAVPWADGVLLRSARIFLGRRPPNLAE
jgi:hypothetical protein